MATQSRASTHVLNEARMSHMVGYPFRAPTHCGRREYQSAGRNGTTLPGLRSPSADRYPIVTAVSCALLVSADLGPSQPSPLANVRCMSTSDLDRRSRSMLATRHFVGHHDVVLDLSHTSCKRILVARPAAATNTAARDHTCASTLYLRRFIPDHALALPSH